MTAATETGPPWYALAAVSLAAGAALWLLAVAALYVPGTRGGDAQRLDWAAARLEVRAGTPAGARGGIRLTLDDKGLGAFVVPLPAAAAGNYPYLELRTGGVSPQTAVTLLWQRGGADAELRRHPIPHSGFSSLWVSLARVPGWEGELGNLGIGFQGRPGAGILLRGVALAPPSLGTFLGATFDEWALFRPWGQPSINAYSGSGTPGPALYPAPAAAALLALSLLVYGVLWLVLRRRLACDWRVPAVLALACWVALDLPWQWRLWRQLAATQEQFAGRSGEERRLAAFDGTLYDFVTEAKASIEDPESRVFLATGQDLFGVRGAYHLFPLNVFWRRHGPELPDPAYLRPGDHVVVLLPKQTRFDPSEGALLWGDGHRVGVEQLLLKPEGGLFRVR